MDRLGKYKYMGLVAFVFLLPFLILSRHFALGVAELEKKEALSYMEMRTRGAANVAAGLLSRDYNVSSLYSSGELLSLSSAERRKLLDAKIKQNPSLYSGFSLLDASGREVLCAGPAAPSGPRDYSGSELLRAARKRTASGAVEYGAYTPPVLVLLAPLSKKTAAKPEGFLVARMSLAYLGELVRTMGRKAPGILGLMDAGGQLISDSPGRSIMEPGVSAPDGVLGLVRAASVRGLDDLSGPAACGGRECLASVSRVSGTGWWMFEMADASRPLRYATAAWVRRVILTGVLLIFIFTFISYRLALRWLVPLRQGRDII
jgi:hypothetical protein